MLNGVGCTEWNQLKMSSAGSSGGVLSMVGRHSHGSFIPPGLGCPMVDVFGAGFVLNPT